jgi:hypothetical protein
MDALYLNFRIVDTPSARFQALTQAALRPKGFLTEERWPSG